MACIPLTPSPLQSPSEMEDADLRQPPLSEEKAKRLVVILAGAPGSGKTTFCNDVMSAGRRPWVRICQDTIANGKAGTKLQCLKSAADALKDGKSVFIDRCNLEREQRAEFVKLGGTQAEVHAVVLDLPARLCISRSVKRTGHEGNLQGGKAAAVVNRMLQKKELPKLSEGFTRITFCQNESDVKHAVNTYSALGPSDSLSFGSFGQKSTDAKVQLGIMKFLKKVEVPNNVVSDQTISQDFIPRQESKEIDSSSMELDKANEDVEYSKGKDLLAESSATDPSCKDVHTLAFPSFSTSNFQFNCEKASDIIVESVANFLNMVDNGRLVLVDLSHESNILSLVRDKAAKKNIDTNRFFTFVGDITRLSTEGNLRCNVIANAANWRLKPGGGGVNAAIFNAAGKTLEVATKERAETLTPGSAVAVPLPSTSPLYQKQGVTHVIHVLGPNMNPLRPNCLKDDYVKGNQVLRNAYSSLFKNFSSISQSRTCSSGLQDSQNNPIEVLRDDRSSHSDQKMKRGDRDESESNKKCKELQSETNSTAAESDEKAQTNRKSAKRTSRTWASWDQALHRTAMHPENSKDGVVEISDDFVVLNDLYPKAKRHVLILSRLDGLDSLADVQKEHLPLLKKLHSAGLKWAEKFSNDDASLIFRLGYHSVPSMRQLHLHVISQDFDSTHLKNKKHWNSFTTPFFRDSVDVIEEIGRCGVAKLNGDDDKFLSMELRCHRCRSAHPNIPKLKSHIANCRASFPSHLLQNGRLVLAPNL